MNDDTGATVWFTGLSGSGKTSVAAALGKLLDAEGRSHFLLDGDSLREGLNSDLGFGIGDRIENVRRVGEVARLFCQAGLVALVPVISPFRTGREAVRDLHHRAHLVFIEVFMDTPLDECERRDAKGLYRRARAGEIPDFTGIDSPYEAPVAPELVLSPHDGDAEAMARRVLQLL